MDAGFIASVEMQTWTGTASTVAQGPAAIRQHSGAISGQISDFPQKIRAG